MPITQTELAGGSKIPNETKKGYKNVGICIMDIVVLVMLVVGAIVSSGLYLKVDLINAARVISNWVVENSTKIVVGAIVALAVIQVVLAERAVGG